VVFLSCACANDPLIASLSQKFCHILHKFLVLVPTQHDALLLSACAHVPWSRTGGRKSRKQTELCLKIGGST